MREGGRQRSGCCAQERPAALVLQFGGGDRDSRRSRVEHGLGFGLQGQFQAGFGLGEIGLVGIEDGGVVIDVSGFDGGVLEMELNVADLQVRAWRIWFRNWVWALPV
ncbi:hypothetical protein M0R45_036128 [Rubus argutus]|uniref:Uncharacterized protein n=1 Tax=Rubus argutus TaxID=59490 RepID=A0AAW1VW32_RUBAR